MCGGKIGGIYIFYRYILIAGYIIITFCFGVVKFPHNRII